MREQKVGSNLPLILSDWFRHAEREPWGLKAEESYCQPEVFVSKEGIDLIRGNATGLNDLVEAILNYDPDDTEKRGKIEKLLGERFTFIDNGAEGSVYEINLGDSAVILKKFDQDMLNGLEHFEETVKHRSHGKFEVVTPYLATRHFFLMSKLPSDALPLGTFIRENPSEAIAACRAMLWLQKDYKFTDAGCPADFFQLLGSVQDLTSRADEIKGAYILNFDPNKTGNDRFRFFLLDFRGPVP